MLGTIINTITIVTGTIIGNTLKRGIKEEYRHVLFNAMGLAAVALGFNAVSNNLPKS